MKVVDKGLGCICGKTWKILAGAHGSLRMWQKLKLGVSSRDNHSSITDRCCLAE